MKTVSAWPALCAGDWPVTGEFPSQKPVTRSFDVFFDLHRMNAYMRRSTAMLNYQCANWDIGVHRPNKELLNVSNTHYSIYQVLNNVPSWWNQYAYDMHISVIYEKHCIQILGFFIMLICCAYTHNTWTINIGVIYEHQLGMSSTWIVFLYLHKTGDYTLF